MQTYLGLITSVVLFTCVLTCGCAPVKAFQKERLSDRIMIFDFDAACAILQADILAAREGAVGGYGSANAGGCSCK